VAQAGIVAPEVPVVGNASATALTDADGVRAELAAQVARTVRWHESITLMADAGVTRFIEFGPGRVLTGLARRLAPGAELMNVSNLAEALGSRDGVGTKA
jgi:[acyl-carrier-protein] S-malonyltransferase